MKVRKASSSHANRRRGAIRRHETFRADKILQEWMYLGLCDECSSQKSLIKMHQLFIQALVIIDFMLLMSILSSPDLQCHIATCRAGETIFVCTDATIDKPTWCASSGRERELLMSVSVSAWRSAAAAVELRCSFT